MDILKRIRFLMNQKGWSEYKLAKVSGIPQSTINSMFKYNNNPSIYTLECLCKTFEISLSDFFNEIEDVELVSSIENKLLCEKWSLLSQNQKDAFINLMDSILEKQG